MRHSVLVACLLLPTLSSAQVRGVDTNDIDRSVNPCTDFDAYANGQWRASHPIPDIQVTWAIRTITQDETRARSRAIAEEDAGRGESLPKGSPGRLSGDFYAACMDEGRIDALGLHPLEPLLKRTDAVSNPQQLGAEIARLQQIDIAAPVEISPAQDLHNPDQMIAEINVTGLGLPDRDYYLRNEPRFQQTREQYIVYARKCSHLPDWMIERQARPSRG